MNVQENINQHVADLPEHLRVEVLDCILSLERKHSERPAQKTFIQKLMEIPDVGLDEDYERIQDTSKADDVFD